MGSYRLGDLLGRGGMGEVYLATHRMLARPAAIKLIRAEVLAAGDAAMAQTAVARFRREAEAAARLRAWRVLLEGMARGSGRRTPSSCTTSG